MSDVKINRPPTATHNQTPAPSPLAQVLAVLKQIVGPGVAGALSPPIQPTDTYEPPNRKLSDALKPSINDIVDAAKTARSSGSR
jgi:hypothetical protein